MFTLYAVSLSANARKPLALCRHLDLAPEVVDVDVYRGEGRRPEFLALNPHGKVPMLIDGALTLTESNAILVYISEAYGEHRLWSRDPARRADIARWMFWEAAHWQPALIGALAQHAGHVMMPEHVAPPEHEPDWTSLAPVLGHLETHLERQPWLAGNAVSLADFSVIAMTIFFRRLGFPFDAYPALSNWYDRVHRLPAWAQTHAEPWLP